MLKLKRIAQWFKMSRVRTVPASKPVVVVLGATGTGKSKLALEIARKFNGEIISADSMQVYKGLDVITNKVTKEEQQLARHHLLDFVDPLQHFNVKDFQKLALKTIADLHAAGKLPVLVGGTHYYIESVLWNVLVDYKKNSISTVNSENDISAIVNTSKYNVSSLSEISDDCNQSEKSDKVCCFRSENCTDSNDNSTSGKDSDDIKCCNSGEDRSVQDEHGVNNTREYSQLPRCKDSSGSRDAKYTRDMADSTQSLYHELSSVDPDRARCLNPNERRKIIRSLQVWQETGVPHSQHLQLQKEEEGGNVLGGGIRYPNTVLLWTACQQEVLDKRLDDRVDDMLSRGLLTELLDFHDNYNKQRLTQHDTGQHKRGMDDRQQPPGDKDEISRHGDTRKTNNCLNETLGLQDEISRNMNDRKIDHGLHNDPGVLSDERLQESDRLEEVCDEDVSSSKVDKQTGTDPNSSSHPKDITDSPNRKKRKLDRSDIPTDVERCNSDIRCNDVVKADTEVSNNVIVVSAEDAAAQLKADYTLGIFQSIGFKEFHEYLILPTHLKETEMGQTLYKKGVETLKIATRRYARRQIKWIRNRFTKEMQRQVPPMYSFDATDPSSWSSEVNAPAVAVVEALLSGAVVPSHIQPVPSVAADPAEVEGRFERNVCEACDRVFIGRKQWQFHLAGNKHKKVKDSKAKALKQEQMMNLTDKHCLQEKPVEHAQSN